LRLALARTGSRANPSSWGGEIAETWRLSALILARVKPQFVSLSELHRFHLAEGVDARAVFGDGAMLNLVELAPGAVVPAHSHPHEQLGVVLRGELKLVAADQERVLRPMDAYALPSEVEHGAQAGAEGALVLDVFQPIREDYRSAASAD
jgi:quercetin dioxygenase-like cupin family protein